MLNEKDPDGKKYVIRLLNTFEHHNHLCIVFECLHQNLREVLKNFGKGAGLSLEGVKMYGQ